jgi:hypothetical protein
MKKNFGKLILGVLGAVLGLGSCGKCSDCFEVNISYSYYSNNQRRTYCSEDFASMNEYNTRKTYFENQCGSPSSYTNCTVQEVQVCDR